MEDALGNLFPLLSLPMTLTILPYVQGNGCSKGSPSNRENGPPGGKKIHISRSTHGVQGSSSSNWELPRALSPLLAQRRLQGGRPVPHCYQIKGMEGAEGEYACTWLHTRCHSNSVSTSTTGFPAEVNAVGSLLSRRCSRIRYVAESIPGTRGSAMVDFLLLKHAVAAPQLL